MRRLVIIACFLAGGVSLWLYLSWFLTPVIPASGTALRDCPECPEMVVIPPGSFQMGSPSSERGRWKDEGPVHKVTIRYPLAVGKYPITRGEWRKYVSETGKSSHGRYRKWDNPGFPQDDRHPVVCVTWQDAQDYAAWLSKKSGHHYRLLTEAEYEYTNRAGSQTAYFWGDWDDDLPRYASRKFTGTTAVGSFEPNAFGLYDTTGSVWSWTQDCYHDTYQGAPADGSAWGNCDGRVVRGGGYYNQRAALRSANRHGNGVPGGDGYTGVGFRLARTLP